MTEHLVSKVETRLADALEARGIRISRQVSVPAPGSRPFSLDIAVVDARVDIEVDGPHHDTPSQQAKDAYRDKWLHKQGWEVIRIPAHVVDADVEGTAATLARMLEKRGALGWKAWPAMMLRRLWRNRVILLLLAAFFVLLGWRLLEAEYRILSLLSCAFAVLLSLRVPLFDHRRGMRRKPFTIATDIAIFLFAAAVFVGVIAWLSL